MRPARNSRRLTCRPKTESSAVCQKSESTRPQEIILGTTIARSQISASARTLRNNRGFGQASPPPFVWRLQCQGIPENVVAGSPRFSKPLESIFMIAYSISVWPKRTISELHQQRSFTVTRFTIVPLGESHPQTEMAAYEESVEIPRCVNISGDAAKQRQLAAQHPRTGNRSSHCFRGTTHQTRHIVRRRISLPQSRHCCSVIRNQTTNHLAINNRTDTWMSERTDRRTAACRLELWRRGREDARFKNAQTCKHLELSLNTEGRFFIPGSLPKRKRKKHLCHANSDAQ